MKKILFKITNILLIAIMLISISSNIIYAKTEISEAYIKKIGQADYHLQYYREERGIYTYLICSIVGHYENGTFYPAYCLNRDLGGVESVNSYTVDVDSIYNNDSVWRVVRNGYPYKTPSEIGVDSEYNAYFVTKMAIYCVIGQADINLFKANEDDEIANQMLNSLKRLVDIGVNGTETYKDGNLNILEITDLYEDGNYYSKNYTVSSDVPMESYTVTGTDNFPEDTYVSDMDGNNRNTFNSNENFKISIPKEKMNQDISGTINVEANLDTYPILYGKTRIEGTQNYLVTVNSYSKEVGNINLNAKTNTGIIEILKVDSKTGEPLEGVEFELTKEDGKVIATTKTNKKGLAYFEGLYQGNYLLIEKTTKEGYILNNTEILVRVEYNQISTLEVENEKIKGKIKIIKTAEEDNAINNNKTGSPISDTVFGIYDSQNKLVEKIITNSDGIAISSELPKGKYIIKEIQSNKCYINDNTEYEVEIKNNEQIINLEITNKSKNPDVEIEKKGPDIVTTGEEIEYEFCFANNGNVSLDNFNWIEYIPTDYIRLNKLQTGTYNENLEYSLYYKTNLNDYVLYKDNLQTSINNEIDFTNIILQENEYITEIKVDFGTVKQDFKTVTSPIMYAKVNSNINGDEKFTNKTQITGKHLGYEVTDDSEYTSITKAKVLPKTGF